MLTREAIKLDEARKTLQGGIPRRLLHQQVLDAVECSDAIVPFEKLAVLVAKKEVERSISDEAMQKALLKRFKDLGDDEDEKENPIYR